MRVFDLLTTSSDDSHSKAEAEDEPAPRKRAESKSIREKIDKYSDSDLDYEQIAMPEIEVSVYFVDKEEKLGTVDTVAKVKRVLRYHHLTRCEVDDKDYPLNQEYFLYSCGKVNQLLLVDQILLTFLQYLGGLHVPHPQQVPGLSATDPFGLYSSRG